MTASLVALVALAVLPIVLTLAFTGCGDLLGYSDEEPAEQKPAQPSQPAPPAPVQYEAVVLGEKNSLLSYWRLDEASGKVAYDIGPAKRDGTYSNSGVTLGQPGALAPKDPDKAVAFDGKNGVMHVDQPPPIPMSFSLECWIKPTYPVVSGWETTQYVAVSRDAASAKNFGFELAVVRDPDPSPRVIARIGDGVAGDPFHEATVNLPTGAEQGAWRHVVMTYDGVAKTLMLWVTSVSDLITQTSPPTSSIDYAANTANPLRVGAGGGAGARDFFFGSIDEVAIYNPPLDPTHVRPHFDASRP